MARVFPVVRVFSSALLPGFIGPESSVLPMDLPPSASSPLRGRRSRFGFQYRVSADWITQCPLSVWVDAPTVGPDIEAIGLPGVRHATSSYTVRLQLPSVTTVGYRDSLSYACSSPSGHPSSRFAVRYVHEFCLMLSSGRPISETARALLVFAFRPITVAFLPSVGVPCPAHISYRPLSGRYDEGPPRGPRTNEEG